MHWCFSPSIRPKPGGYVFTTQIASRDQQRALMTYFQARGWTRIALITTTDASGQDAEKAINELVKEPEFADVQLVEQNHFNASDVSITAQIARIQAAKPQVIISWATAAAGATVFRALVQAGIDLPVAASGSNMTYGQMTQYASFLPKQLFFGVSAWAAAGDPGDRPPAGGARRAEALLPGDPGGRHPSRCKLRYRLGAGAARRRRPEPAAAEGATAAQLHDYLEHFKGYAGIDGIYDFTKFPQRGLGIEQRAGRALGRRQEGLAAGQQAHGHSDQVVTRRAGGAVIPPRSSPAPCRAWSRIPRPRSGGCRWSGRTAAWWRRI